MQFEVKDQVQADATTCFSLLRDEMTDLVPFMPDTEEITVLSREDVSEDEVKIVNRWRASQSKIPSALRAFVKPELLSWNDHARWTSSDMTGRWELEAIGSDKLFSCQGETSIIEEGGAVYLKIKVEFEVYPENVPGVPKFVAKRVGPQIEKVIGEVLSVNLRQMAQSINAYAAQRG